MRRKGLKTLGASLTAILCLLACVACGKKEEKHEHTYIWAHDSTHHWKVATCGHEAVAEYGEHTLAESGYCEVCAMPIRPSNGVAYVPAEDGSHYVVSGFEGTATDLIFEKEINGLPVKGIREKAFEGLPITSVRISENMTYMEASAFNQCENLEKVYYEGDIEKWCQIDFATPWANPVYYAHNLYIKEGLVTEFVLSEEVKTIKPCVFAGAECLQKIVVHEEVKTIGGHAFEGCTNALKNDNGVYYVSTSDNPYFAVVDCTSQMKMATVTINASTKLIADSAFQNIRGVDTVICADNVESIGQYAFGYASVKEVRLGKNTKTINQYAFANATGLTTVRFGRGLGYIGRYAFQNCNALANAYFDTSNYTINTLWQVISSNYYTLQLKGDTFSSPAENARRLKYYSTSFWDRYA